MTLDGAFHFLTLFSISLFVLEDCTPNSHFFFFFFYEHDNTIFANSELMRDYQSVREISISGYRYRAL